MTHFSQRMTAAEADGDARGVVGAALLDPLVIDRYSAKLPHEAFDDLALLAFWDLLCDLRQAGKSTISQKTVAYEAKRRQFNRQTLFDAIGGAAGMARLGVNDRCEPSSVADSVSRLTAYSQFKRLKAIQQELAERLDSSSESPQAIANWLQERILEPIGSTDEGPIRLSKLIERAAIGEPDQQPRKTVKSGLISLDSRTGGWHPGNMVILAARPSIGKSALGWQMCVEPARRGMSVLFVSIEMTDDELAARDIAGETGLNANDVLAQRLEEEDRAKIRQLAASEDLPVYVWAPSYATVAQVEAQARCLKAAGGCDFICLDYISLLSVPGKSLPEWERVTRLSRDIKQMAKRLKVPVLALCQVSRDTEKGSNTSGQMKPPTLADLRYSGGIEQDADVVMFLHRESRQRSETELILAKGRNLQLGKIALQYEGPAFRFLEQIQEFA